MKRALPWISLILAALLLVGVYFYIQSALKANSENVRQERPAAKETPLEVSVMDVQSGSHAASITALGLASAKQNLTLTAQVSGEVTQIASVFEVGERVKKGQQLVTLKNISLLADVASAENTLSAAQLALKEEQRQGEQASSEWRAAGLTGEPASDLVLRKPQLDAAKAEVTSAKAALQLAQDNVKKLTITAPFDAIVVSKTPSLGSYLNSGSEIGTLYSTDEVTIELPLSASDWQKLPDLHNMIKSKWPANIAAVNTSGNWQGFVKQASLHIDPESGLRSLFVTLPNPLKQATPLLPGSYVQVTLSGKPENNLWQLPSSALSQKSQIWYVTSDNRLANFDTTPKFVDAEFVYIEVPEALRSANQKVLTHPYNSYLTGMLVAPKEGTKE